MFLPTTPRELKKLGWQSPDVIIVTGDTYIDSPYIGAAVIGRVLENAGYTVGIIAQPDTKSDTDITRLGEPNLFWGITAGSVDSLVANYTALKKFRKSDDFTPGGKNNRRPDRATIVYANLIKRYFKNTTPLVLGGIEASMRRIAHYDYWDNKIRRSILFDAKADILVYGMAEKTILELAERLKNNEDYRDVRGLCYISQTPKSDSVILPSFQDVRKDKRKFIEMFHEFYQNNDPITAKVLCQQQDTRFLVQNPPNIYLAQKELDEIHNLGYQRDVHPYYKRQGKVKALETITFSINSHRGCYGECNFCSITVHQGKKIRWRSEESIINEAKSLIKLDDFKGYIHDVGGPTANMYGFDCEKREKTGSCADRRCLFPQKCPKLNVNHKKQIELLRKLRRIDDIKKVFIGSGIRYDLVLEDEKYGDAYLREVIEHHVSGQMKIAPEHTEENVLRMMGKPPKDYLTEFKNKFYRITQNIGKKQFLTYYFIAAHPGSDYNDMKKLKRYIRKELKINPEQVQIFTPLPSTYSALMYHTEMNPFTGENIFVEKNMRKKEKQKKVVVG